MTSSVNDDALPDSAEEAAAAALQKKNRKRKTPCQHAAADDDEKEGKQLLQQQQKKRAKVVVDLWTRKQQLKMLQQAAKRRQAQEQASPLSLTTQIRLSLHLEKVAKATRSVLVTELNREAADAYDSSALVYKVDGVEFDLPAGRAEINKLPINHLRAAASELLFNDIDNDTRLDRDAVRERVCYTDRG